MNRFYGLLLLLCPYFSPAQIEIGQPVPELVFRQVRNSAADSLRLADRPLVLLDFWATWCSACIREFPTLDSLQRQFPENLRILLVSSPKNDDPAKIERFFRQRSNQRVSLPVVCNAPELDTLFPHQSLPHTAWIYRGRYIGASSAEAVTAANIRQVLAGGPVPFMLKKDQLDFNPDAPLIDGGNGGDYSRLLFRSSVTRYLDGVRVGTGTVFQHGLQRRYYLNLPVMGLYALAYPGMPLVPDSALAPLLFSDHPDMAWKKTHCFCYELLADSALPAPPLQALMRQDLDRAFGIRSSIENLAVDCFVLVREQDLPLRDLKDTCFTKKEDGSLSVHNRPLADFIQYLNFQSPGKPLPPDILNESGYEGLVQFDLPPGNLHDRSWLNQQLKAYGYALQPARRTLTAVALRPAFFPTHQNH